MRPPSDTKPAWRGPSATPAPSSPAPSRAPPPRCWSRSGCPGRSSRRWTRGRRWRPSPCRREPRSRRPSGRRGGWWRRRRRSARRGSTPGWAWPPTRRCWPAPIPAPAPPPSSSSRCPTGRARRGSPTGSGARCPISPPAPSRSTSPGSRSSAAWSGARAGWGGGGAPPPRADGAARWPASARRLLEPLKTLADVRDAYSGTQPTVEVSLERQRIAQYGLSVDAGATALAGGLGGVASGESRETDRRTPITVRFAGNANEDLATALVTPVRGIPVGQLVSVREMRAPVEVVRINQRPVSVVEAVVERGGTARATRDVRLALAGLTPPPGVTWQIAGADAEQRRTTRQLALVAVLSAALMYLVLAGEFGSFTVPLLVMLTVPLAAAGGLIFLWMTGQSLNAVSLIGIVVMIGMADNEAVVKLDAIRRFREQGHSIEEAVLLGGGQRLRAIAMTSITTVTGVLPLMFGWGGGGALYKPLAAGVIGGSVTALLVTFFLLPTAYAWMERRKDGKTEGRRDA